MQAAYAPKKYISVRSEDSAYPSYSTIHQENYPKAVSPASSSRWT